MMQWVLMSAEETNLLIGTRLGRGVSQAVTAVYPALLTGGHK
jgi:hypothetical protein